MFLGPNTNTNTIRFQKCGRIRIRILFGFRNMAEYEYEYYSGSEIWPNTNTKTIQSATFVRLLIQKLGLFDPSLVEQDSQKNGLKLLSG